MEEKNYKKEIYYDEMIGKVSLIINTLTLLIPMFCILGIVKGGSKADVIKILLMNIVCLYMYIYSSTTCIYLEDDYLYKRNLFIKKKYK